MPLDFLVGNWEADSEQYVALQCHSFSRSCMLGLPFEKVEQYRFFYDNNISLQCPVVGPNYGSFKQVNKDLYVQTIIINLY